MSQKPEYRLHIFGIGKIGRYLTEYIATTQPHFVDGHLESIHLYHRDVQELYESENGLLLRKGNRLTGVSPDLIKIISQQESRFAKRIWEERHQFHPYHALSELSSSVLGSSTEKDILVLTTRYLFPKIKEKDISKRTVDHKISVEYANLKKGGADESVANLIKELNELLKIRSNIIATSCEAVDTDELLLKKKAEIIDEQLKLESLVQQMTTEGKIDPKRIGNIIGALWGVKEFGKYLNQMGFRGLVINAVNPIDETSHILRIYSGSRKIAGLCDHDRTRIHVYVEEALKSRGYKVKELYIPVVGMHNEHQRGILKESFFITENGESKYLSEIPGFEDIWEDIHKQANVFGIREFEEFGDSASDTARAIFNNIKSYICPDSNPLKVSIYQKVQGNDISIGIPVTYQTHQLIPAKHCLAYITREAERNSINSGIVYMIDLFNKLRGLGLVVGEITHESPTPMGDYRSLIKSALSKKDSLQRKRKTIQSQTSVRDTQTAKELRDKKIKDSLRGIR